MNNIYDNEMKIEFLSKSNNEAFARISVAAFVAQLDPTLEEIADIKTAVSEAVTNAIIHANSKNIKVVITARDNYIEMVITNDGNKPKSVIFENEGIKGMRKKLSNINGSLKVITDDNFKLIIKA